MIKETMIISKGRRDNALDQHSHGSQLHPLMASSSHFLERHTEPTAPPPNVHLHKMCMRTWTFQYELGGYLDERGAQPH